MIFLIKIEKKKPLEMSCHHKTRAAEGSRGSMSWATQ